MSTTKPTGGPAFPCEYVKHAPGAVGNNVPIMAYAEGVTVRDWFAAHALQGIIGCFRDHTGYESTAGRVRKAYEYADAMLEARSK